MGFADWAWVFALSSILVILPVSFGGIGVCEGSIAGAFALVGVAPAETLPVALLRTAFAGIGATAGALVEIAVRPRIAR